MLWSAWQARQSVCAWSRVLAFPNKTTAAQITAARVTRSANPRRKLKPPKACFRSGEILLDLKNPAHPGTSKAQLLSAASDILPSSFSGGMAMADLPVRLVHHARVLKVSYKYEKTPIRGFTSVTRITKTM
jgi:hypothetical protein